MLDDTCTSDFVSETEDVSSKSEQSKSLSNIDLGPATARLAVEALAKRIRNGTFSPEDTEYIKQGLFTRSEQALIKRALRKLQLETAVGLQKVPNVISLNELVKIEFAKPKFLVEELIPEGLIQIAAEPKVGKTWFGLQIGMGITLEMPVLGGLRTNKRAVLYLALEDGPRRIKWRVRQLMEEGFGDGTLPDNFHVMFDCPEGSVSDIEKQIAAIEEATGQKIEVVIVDTWTAFRTIYSGGDKYKNDSIEWNKLRKLTNVGVNVIVLNHLTKSNAYSDSIAERIAGANSGRAATDGNMIIERNPNEDTGTLYREMRDTASGKIGLQFTGETGLWKTLEYVPEPELNGTLRAVVAEIRKTKDKRQQRDPIYKVLKPKHDPGTVKRTITRALKRKQLYEDPDGWLQYVPDILVKDVASEVAAEMLDEG